MPIYVGQIVNHRYRIDALLGQGGMGAVYRAWDVNLNIPVALKEMTPDPHAAPYTLAQLRQQFQREAQVVANLDHPNLVRVTDYFPWGGSECMVMNLVEGESLAERIERGGAQPEAQMLEWARQLLDALAYCHARGVIHRDVKPQNVIITLEDKPVLVDFGLVKLWDPQNPHTQTVIRAMGTPEYAPPEQYSVITGHTDPRSDLYSLGATLYHALTGQAPMSATDRMAMPERFVSPRALDSHVSPQTEAAVLRAMELPITKRFGTAQEMAAALALALPPSSIFADIPVPRRRIIPVWALSAGVILLIGLLAGCVVAIGILGASVQRRDASSTVQSTLALTPTSTPQMAMAISTIRPTSTVQPISMPTPTVTELQAMYYPVSLDGVSNSSLTVDFTSPPVGNVTLDGVPFQLSERVFKSQASPSPNNGYLTHITLPVDVSRAKRLHLLLTTGNGFKQFSGMMIGEIMVHCDDIPMSVTDLQLGRDVREWHVADNVVSTASRVRQVWSGAITNFPNLTGHIDMLSLDLPEACLNGNLTGIEIIDSSTSTVNSLDPALNLIGVTVEHYP